MQIPVLEIASILIVLAAFFGVLNHFFLRLPPSIGIMVVALMSSFALLLVGNIFPALNFENEIRHVVNDFEFSDALLEGMLGLLLFAGALHVSVEELRKQAIPVLLMATIGVAISAAIIGYGFSWLTGMPLLVALVFGTLITATDPVAVQGTLKLAGIRKSLETKISGESLFNDGVVYVLYLVLVAMAFPALGGDQHHEMGIQEGLVLFVQEALGGAVLGAVLGWFVFQLMKRIDDYPLEVLLTLALAFGGYTLAVHLHVSGPIMAVVSGLFIGHVGMAKGMSEQTRSYVDAFWKLIDELLNAVLFLMIGFEVFATEITGGVISGAMILYGLAAVVLSLVARLAAVAVPIKALGLFGKRYDNDVIPVMTWGGIKGGISIALALSLPESEWKHMIVTVAYIVVVFSILVQGLTVAPLAKKLSDKHWEGLERQRNEEALRTDEVA